jgi:sn1-specific diacylglycerol lipase
MVSFILESGIQEEDIYYISFRNKLYQTPFVVLADHATQSIVITIRGSASILDFVTDLSLNEDVFSIDVDKDPILCQDHELDSEGAVRVHRGMLKSAHFVYNALKKNRILEELKILNPSYQLVICGHSLGAGVASLLTLLLK